MVEDDTISKLHCERCGLNWFPKSVKTPKVCPACKSKKWDTPLKEGERARKSMIQRSVLIDLETWEQAGKLPVNRQDLIHNAFVEAIQKYKA